MCNNCVELNHICEYCLGTQPLSIIIETYKDESIDLIENEFIISYEDREEVWCCYANIIDILSIKNNWENLESGYTNYSIPYKKYKNHIIQMKNIYYN